MYEHSRCEAERLRQLSGLSQVYTALPECRVTSSIIKQCMQKASLTLHLLEPPPDSGVFHFLLCFWCLSDFFFFNKYALL